MVWRTLCISETARTQIPSDKSKYRQNLWYWQTGRISISYHIDGASKKDLNFWLKQFCLHTSVLFLCFIGILGVWSVIFKLTYAKWSSVAELHASSAQNNCSNVRNVVQLGDAPDIVLDMGLVWSQIDIWFVLDNPPKISLNNSSCSFERYSPPVLKNSFKICAIDWIKWIMPNGPPPVNKTEFFN